MIQFRLRQGSALELIKDKILFFAEGEQRLHELNPSSAILLDRLTDRASIGELESALVQYGSSPQAAADWVPQFLSDLSQLALLEADPAEFDTDIEQRIRLAGVGLSLRYQTTELFELLGGPYEHLRDSAGELRTTYDISEGDGFVLINDGGQAAAVVNKHLAAVRLKGMLLEEILTSAEHLFALHAACLIRNGAAVLLLGPPGAGKSTLTLELMRRGFRYGSDDVTLVTESGNVRGVSLAPGYKEGVWDRLPEELASAASIPTHWRPDGQRVRFPHVGAAADAGVWPVSTIIRLRRSGTQAPTFNTLSSTEVIRELLSEARSPDGKCSVKCFEAIGKLVRGAESAEMKYSEAADAAEVLSSATT